MITDSDLLRLAHPGVDIVSTYDYFHDRMKLIVVKDGKCEERFIKLDKYNSMVIEEFDYIVSGMVEELNMREGLF